MKNLTLENITNTCKGTYHGPEALLSQEVTDVVIDSRKVEKGNLFVAIDGENVNAHKFIPDTIEKGALCVVSHEDLGDTDYPYILVESTGQALLDIAKLYRDSFDVKVVGITGSVGKTSTKEMIASVVAQKYHVHKTLGNFNNEWGLPLSIFQMNETHEVAVLELGVNHFGEMRRLSAVATPDICVITNIGVAHLEFFKTREGILQEKSSMIQDMKNGGTIILNGDDDLLSQMGPVKGSTPVFFGLGENSQFRADHIKPLGLTPEEIKAGIENYTTIPGRNHLIQTDSLTILDDCYNANPVSTNAALDVLALSEGRKVAVLGDMGELGENELDLHYQVGAYAAGKGIDLVCGIGPMSESLIRGVNDAGTSTKGLWFATKEDFLAAMDDLIKNGDNVLVKASKYMKLPVVIEALKER